MITSLHKSEGTTLTTHQEIRNYIAASYASAYKRMTTEEAKIKQVRQWISRRLTPQANMSLAEPITVEELQKGNRQRTSEQSPGSRRYCT